MGIFTKFCPQCSDSVEASRARCQCGYLFDTTTDGSICTGDLLEQNERMYLEYLEARAAQVEQEYEVARNACTRDTNSRLAAAELLRAEQALNNIRAELAAQTSRLETTRATIRRNRPIAPKAVQPPVAQPEPAVTPPRATEALRELQARQPTRLARPSPAIKPEPRVPMPPVSPRVQPELKANPRSVEATATPGENFRAAQANRAAKAMMAKVEKPRHVPVPPKATPAMPRSANPLLSARAAMEAKHAKPPNTRECPNCTAMLALEISRCRCGYEFPTQGAEIPSLTLPTTDLAEIAQNLTLGPLDRER